MRNLHLCCGSLSFAWCRSGPLSPATMAVADGDGSVPVKTFFFTCLWRSLGPALHQLNRRLRWILFDEISFVMDRSNIYSLFQMRFGIFFEFDVDLFDLFLWYFNWVRLDLTLSIAQCVIPMLYNSIYSLDLIRFGIFDAVSEIEKLDFIDNSLIFYDLGNL